MEPVYKPSNLNTYDVLVLCAKYGNRDAARKILQVISWCMENDLKIPKPFRKYYSDCVTVHLKWKRTTHP